MMERGVRSQDSPVQSEPSVGDETYGFGRPIGQILRDFRLMAKLGEGGMGMVFKAHWLETDVDVALKILSPRLAADREFVQRFRREAKMSLMLNHPNIVRGFTVGEQGGVHYFAMEFLEGANLESWLQRLGRLSVGDAVRITIDVARALDHAHSRRPDPIFHRDVKPANIIITPDGEVKLTDLGLAKAAEDDSGLTQVGEGAGTPAYMPPEQARNARMADNRSDIYALGATLYVLLTGRKPFSGKTLAEVVEAKEAGKFEPAHSLNPQVPEELDAILAKMLAPDPRRRFATAGELIAALQATNLANARLGLTEEATLAATLTATPSPSSIRRRANRRLRLAALAAAVIGVVGVGGYLSMHRGSDPVTPVAPVKPPVEVAPPQGNTGLEDVADVRGVAVKEPNVPASEPTDAILQRAVQQITDEQIEDARATLAKGVAGHPGEEVLNRSLQEIAQGMLLLFQSQTPDETKPIVPMWSAAGKTTLTSQDNYRFAMIPGRKCYVYAYQRDTVPSVTRIFPNPDFSPRSNPLPAQRVFWLPDDPSGNGPSWLHLDTSVGKEQVYFVATTKPLRDPDAVGAKLEKNPDDLQTALARNLEQFLQPGGPAGQPCFASAKAVEVFAFNHR